MTVLPDTGLAIVRRVALDEESKVGVSAHVGGFLTGQSALCSNDNDNNTSDDDGDNGDGVGDDAVAVAVVVRIMIVAVVIDDDGGDDYGMNSSRSTSSSRG